MTASRDCAGDDAVPAVDVDYACLMALLRSPQRVVARQARRGRGPCAAHDARGGIPCASWTTWSKSCGSCTTPSRSATPRRSSRRCARLCALRQAVRGAGGVRRRTPRRRGRARARARLRCLALQARPRAPPSPRPTPFAPSAPGDRAEKTRRRGGRGADAREPRAARAAGCAPACLGAFRGGRAREGCVTPGGEDDAVVLRSAAAHLDGASRDAACAARMASAGA